MMGDSFYSFFAFVLDTLKDCFSFLDDIYPFVDVPYSLFWLIITGGVSSLIIYYGVNIYLNSRNVDGSGEWIDLDDGFDLDSDWEDYD